ncbi:MAG: glycine cleavage T C-terminal barrel domain-containing protein, partial [Pseudomonadota bacterium]
QAGGAGKVLAEWVTEGGTEWDMWSCDPRRFTGWCDQDYATQKGMEIYGHEYAMHFPHHAWPAGREKRLGPVHSKVLELGGQMGAFNGWERALWYAKDGDDTSEDATQTWDRAGPWEPRVKEECEAVRDACGVLDLPGFARFMVQGEGTAEWLRGTITGALPKVGRIGLGYFSDDKGRIVTEMSLMRLEEDKFMLITAATAEWHDKEWLERHLPDGAAISITDMTEVFSCQIVTGPNSRALLAEITDADMSLPWLSHQTTQVAGKHVQLVRVSFAGELGWEIHSKVEDTAAIWEALWAHGEKHGLRPFGMFALDSLRIEKGYRAWKGDLSTDYTMLEGGLDRFVKLDKPQDFPGKTAIMNQKQQGVAKRFATMLVDAGNSDAPYMSTIWKGDQVVGETTSGGWGYRVGASIALGAIKTEFTEPGTELEIEIYGERRRAVVQLDQPLWDPENERLRA